MDEDAAAPAARAGAAAMIETMTEIGAVAGVVTVVMIVRSVTRMMIAGGAALARTANAAKARTGRGRIGMTRRERPHHSTEMKSRKTVMPRTLLLLTTNFV